MTDDRSIDTILSAYTTLRRAQGVYQIGDVYHLFKMQDATDNQKTAKIRKQQHFVGGHDFL